MIITDNVIWNGAKYKLEYSDKDSFDDLPYDNCQQVYGVCFYKQNIIIVRDKNGGWALAGGRIENGENFMECLEREVMEETNMKVTSAIPIGVQKVVDSNSKFRYQLRYCANVEKVGEFIRDRDDDIVEVKFIKPTEYRKYFDWGEIGERIIKRAIDLRSNLGGI